MPTDTDAPFTVYAPGGAVWAHPRLAWWGVWLRGDGYRGRLPAWAVRTCRATYPALRCACGAYQVVWDKEDDYGEGEK